MAAFLTLVAAAFLAAYRKLKPMPSAAIPTDLAITPTPPAMPQPKDASPDYFNDLQAIRATLEGVTSIVTLQGESISAVASKVAGIQKVEAMPHGRRTGLGTLPIALTI
jgi:hypothetical protein